MSPKQPAYKRPEVTMAAIQELRHLLALAAEDARRYERLSRNEWVATPASEGLRTLIADADAWIADLQANAGGDD